MIVYQKMCGSAEKVTQEETTIKAIAAHVHNPKDYVFAVENGLRRALNTVEESELITALQRGGPSAYPHPTHQQQTPEEELRRETARLNALWKATVEAPDKRSA
jgi:hypothetical protein